MNALTRLAFVAALVAASCGNSTTGPNNSNNSGTKVLTATFNGTAWTATTRIGVWFSGNLSITGNDGEGRNLNITAANVTGPGTYSLAPGNANTALATWIDSTGHFRTGFNGSGTITLTAVSLNRITGTFSFVARDQVGSGPVLTMTVTNGQFDLSNP